MTRPIPDDERLLAACAAGDEQALGLLYDRLGPVAYRLALRVLRDPGLAEDMVQETFLTVWRQADRFDSSRGKVSTWVLTITHRRAVDRVRKEVRLNESAGRLEAMTPRAERAVDDVERVDARREVQALLSTLSRLEREVIELAYWGGLTQSEIADHLGVPLGTVKSRTFTGLARLRETFDEKSTVAASGGSAC